jgi:hypothetical protein
MAITVSSKHVTLTENAKALAIFSQKEQNNIMRAAMYRTAFYWVEMFLPLRFSDYSVDRLGYNPTANWESFKSIMAASQKKLRKTYRRVMAPQPIPMVFTGDMRKAALGRNSIKATATKGKGVAAIRIPFGHPVQAKLSNLFRKLPPKEMEALQSAFKAAFSASLARGTVRAGIKAQKIAMAKVARKVANKAAKAAKKAAGLANQSKSA